MKVEKHMHSKSVLLSPFTLGALQLRNRVLMAPLTRNRADAASAPHALNVEYYRQRAGAGLIISEGSQVSQQGAGYPGTPGIHSQRQIEGWSRVVETVHEAGGRIFLQLWHVGRISLPWLQPDHQLPVAPSAIKAEGMIFTPDGMKEFIVPRALETDEVASVVDQYRTAAANAKKAGFDGVEIHAANGYLIDQFMRDGSNKRTDRYGGSIENRTRFLLEIADAVLEVWDGGRIGVRVSPINGFNTMTDSAPNNLFSYAAEQLGRRGIAYLHVMELDGTGKESRDALDREKLRKAFGGAYIANAGYDQKLAEDAVASGRADAVAFGKLFIANPDLPRRFERGGPYNEPKPALFYGGGSEGYTDYPAMAG